MQKNSKYFIGNIAQKDLVKIDKGGPRQGQGSGSISFEKVR